MKKGNSHTSGSRALIRKVEVLLSRMKEDNIVMEPGISELINELQAQNEELRRSQAQTEELKTKYYNFFNLAPVAYFSFDTDLVIKEVNSTAERLFHKKRSMMLKTPFVVYVAPQYKSILYSHRSKIIESKKRQSCELKLLRGDGKEFYSLLESVPVLNENDVITEIHSTCSDITQRRQIELKKQAKLIQTSVENMLDPFAILRAVKNGSEEIKDFVYEYINEAGCRYNRISKEQILGESLLKSFPAFKTNGIFGHFCKVFESGEPVTLKTITMDPSASGRESRGILDLRINRLNSGVVVTWRDITERLKAEERIHYQSQLIENVSDAIITADDQFRISSWNKAAERIFGLKSEEVAGENVFEIGYHIGMTEKCEEKLKRLKEKGYLATQEIITFDGNSPKKLDSVIIANYDHTGNIKGYIAIIRDITEKLKAEEQILKEKKRLEVLAEISEIFGSVEADFKTVTEYTTRKIASAYNDICIMHLISDNGTKLNNVAFYHPDEKTLDFLKKLFEKESHGITDSITWMVIDSEKPALITSIDKYTEIEKFNLNYTEYADVFGLASVLIVPVMHQGKVIGALSLFRNRKDEPYEIEDQVLLQNVANKISLALANHRLFSEKLNEIEERKSAQKELAAQQQMMRSVLETIPVGVWITDKSGKEILSNKALRNIWGADKLPDQGSDDTHACSAWLPENGKNIDLIKWSSERALLGESLFNQEVLIQCFDNSYKTILNSAVPIKDDTEEVQGAIIVNFDITDRKDYEMKLQQTLDELERSNRELEQFAYIASHDLQEPLRMVSSYTQLLEKQYKDQLDSRAVEYISFAVEGARRMQALIVDLLKYARVTTRAQAFELVDCNLVLREVISDLKMAIDENGAEIVSHDLPEIYADPTQFRQLIQNLIGNGIKFRSSKNPVINVSAVQEKSEWVFSVKDNGIGIDQKHFGRIFMLFQRLHEREKYPGNGIGLAVCKKIVERHGGRIWVESETSKGTSMFFTMPIKN